MVLDPTGRYLYATFRASIKEADYYRMDPPQFVKIELQAGRIVQSFPFPPDMDQGFGAGDLKVRLAQLSEALPSLSSSNATTTSSPLRAHRLICSTISHERTCPYNSSAHDNCLKVP